MRLTFSGGGDGRTRSGRHERRQPDRNPNEKKKLQKIEMRGNSYLRSMEVGHAC